MQYTNHINYQAKLIFQKTETKNIDDTFIYWAVILKFWQFDFLFT